MTLGDVGVNDSFAPISDTVYTINSYGGVLAMYYYVDADTASMWSGSEGWYLDTEIDNYEDGDTPTCQNSVTLSVGQMLVVSSATDGAAVVFSGAVASEDVELTLDTTARNFLVNCTPVDITLGDVAVNASFAPISDTVYTINAYGGVEAMYYYVDADTASMWSGSEGWYLDTEIDNYEDGDTPTCQNSVAVTAGQGLVVSSATDGAAIILPSPL